jgi:hypothetical protein
MGLTSTAGVGAISRYVTLKDDGSAINQAPAVVRVGSTGTIGATTWTTLLASAPAPLYVIGAFGYSSATQTSRFALGLGAAGSEVEQYVNPTGQSVLSYGINGALLARRNVLPVLFTVATGERISFQGQFAGSQTTVYAWGVIAVLQSAVRSV